MKIVATISDCSAAANVGGDVERISYVIEIPQEATPAPILDHLATLKKNRTAREKGEQVWHYVYLSLSILDEQLSRP